MAKCDNCWCEQYDKNNGNCDGCIYEEPQKESPDLRFFLKLHAIEQMELDRSTQKSAAHALFQERE